MSKFTDSQIVQNELVEMQKLYQKLSSMVSKFRDLDIEQKREFMKDTKILLEKQHIFHTRLTLESHSDPEISDLVSRMDAMSQVLCGSSMSNMFNQFLTKLNSFDLDP
jgi:hypothetical protein